MKQKRPVNPEPVATGKPALGAKPPRHPAAGGDSPVDQKHLRAIRAARRRWYRDCLGYNALIEELNARAAAGHSPFAALTATSTHGGDHK